MNPPLRICVTIKQQKRLVVFAKCIIFLFSTKHNSNHRGFLRLTKNLYSGIIEHAVSGAFLVKMSVVNIKQHRGVARLLFLGVRSFFRLFRRTAPNIRLNIGFFHEFKFGKTPLDHNDDHKQNNFIKISGCSAVGSAPALGAGCRGFKSLHSDHIKTIPLIQCRWYGFSHS